MEKEQLDTPETMPENTQTNTIEDSQETVGFYDKLFVDANGKVIQNFNFTDPDSLMPVAVKMGQVNPKTGQVYDGNLIYIRKTFTKDHHTIIRREAKKEEIEKYNIAFKAYLDHKHNKISESDKLIQKEQEIEHKVRKELEAEFQAKWLEQLSSAKSKSSSKSTKSKDSKPSTVSEQDSKPSTVSEQDSKPN